ncbi:MAG TPA: hypothetical protein VGA88_13350, partial [Burkholderiales bacterium]
MCDILSSADLSASLHVTGGRGDSPEVFFDPEKTFLDGVLVSVASELPARMSKVSIRRAAPDFDA